MTEQHNIKGCIWFILILNNSNATTIRDISPFYKHSYMCQIRIRDVWVGGREIDLCAICLLVASIQFRLFNCSAELDCLTVQLSKVQQLNFSKVQQGSHG